MRNRWVARVQPQIHDELAARREGDKPLWVTEIGSSSRSAARECVTEAQHAAYLQTFLNLARAASRSSYLRALYAFGLRDLARHPRDNEQPRFGLPRSDLSHKPAWWVLHDAATGKS